MLRGSGEGAAGGVGGEQRSAAGQKRVLEGLVGDVGDVDHHPEAVQFADHVPAEGSEAVVNRLVDRGVGPCGV
jgi:hypothetical protein